MFAGIWKKGAGLGIAVTLLYAGPSNNVITLMMTGQRIGWQFAFYRLFFSVSFAILIGIFMEFLFRKEKHDTSDLLIPESQLSLKGIKSKVFWISLFSILIIGTAPIPNTQRIIAILALAVLQIAMTFGWLSKDEKAIVTALINKGGELSQSSLGKITAMNKVRIYRVISALEEKAIVKKEKIGMTNKVILDNELKHIYIQK